MTLSNNNFTMTLSKINYKKEQKKRVKIFRNKKYRNINKKHRKFDKIE